MQCYVQPRVLSSLCKYCYSLGWSHTELVLFSYCIILCFVLFSLIYVSMCLFIYLFSFYWTDLFYIFIVVLCFLQEYNLYSLWIVKGDE